jgi:uncharacterized protein DUF3575
MKNRVLTVAAAALIPFAVAPAQDTIAVPAQSIPAAPAQQIVAPHNVISIQPINAVFEVYSAEFEHQVASAASLAVGGTYWNPGDEFDDLTYTSGDLKLRYYPNGTALMGFSFGASVGYTKVTETNTSDGTEQSTSGPTFGVLLEYQWLLGKTRNFAVALGVGAKALMVKEEDISSGDFTARYPTARVSVGFAF